MSRRVSTTPAICGQQAPLAPGTTGAQTLVSGGIERTYLVHLPTRYDSQRTWPVVLVFHGDTASASEIEDRTGFSSLADQDDFVAVYPQGANGRDGSTTWATGGPIDPPVDDVAFVEDLLDNLKARLCVDAGRIYATGFSSGGSMVGILACDLAGRIAAFAPVSGAFYPRSEACVPVRPVSLVEIHGNGDVIVPYSGGTQDSLPSIASWLREWAMRDGCVEGPSEFLRQGDVTGEDWTACSSGATVVHYRIEGGGHEWPSAQGQGARAADSSSFNATALIWQFFQTHPMPQS